MENMTTYVNAYGTVPVKRKRLVILRDIKIIARGDLLSSERGSLQCTVDWFALYREKERQFSKMGERRNFGKVIYLE